MHSLALRAGASLAQARKDLQARSADGSPASTKEVFQHAVKMEEWAEMSLSESHSPCGTCPFFFGCDDSQDDDPQQLER